MKISSKIYSPVVKAIHFHKKKLLDRSKPTVE